MLPNPHWSLGWREPLQGYAIEGIGQVRAFLNETGGDAAKVTLPLCLAVLPASFQFVSTVRGVLLLIR